MYTPKEIQEMLSELRIINDEIKSCKHTLRMDISVVERCTFEEMLYIGETEYAVVETLLRDHYENEASIAELTDLLLVKV